MTGIAHKPASHPALGLLMCVIAAGVLTAFVALAPAGIRKLLLFATGYGLSCGGIVLWCAREFGVPKRWSVAMTPLLIVAGLGVIALQGQRQLRAEQAAAAAAAAAEQKLAQSLFDAAAEQDPALAAQLNRQRSEQAPSFVDYLALRVRPLGEWGPPWPVVFWSVEVLLAAAAGTLLVLRMIHTPPAPIEELA
ncbi:MAG: hypothetical protein AB7I48_28310 [Planctomycetaceae bacterium]